jgi:hypothetical protein
MPREYGVIQAAALNDPNKQCLVVGVLTPCGNQDFESGVQWNHTFPASRSSLVLSEAASDGFQAATGGPQIMSLCFREDLVPRVVERPSHFPLSPAGGMAPGGVAPAASPIQLFSLEFPGVPPGACHTPISLPAQELRLAGPVAAARCSETKSI